MAHWWFDAVHRTYNNIDCSRVGASLFSGAWLKRARKRNVNLITNNAYNKTANLWLNSKPIFISVYSFFELVNNLFRESEIQKRNDPWISHLSAIRRAHFSSICWLYERYTQMPVWPVQCPVFNDRMYQIPLSLPKKNCKSYIFFVWRVPLDN